MAIPLNWECFKKQHAIHFVTKNGDFTGDSLKLLNNFKLNLSSNSFPNHMDPGCFLYIFVEVLY